MLDWCRSRDAESSSRESNSSSSVSSQGGHCFQTLFSSHRRPRRAATPGTVHSLLVQTRGTCLQLRAGLEDARAGLFSFAWVGSRLFHLLSTALGLAAAVCSVEQTPLYTLTLVFTCSVVPILAFAALFPLPYARTAQCLLHVWTVVKT